MAKTRVDGFTAEIESLCNWARSVLERDTKGIPKGTGLSAEKDSQVVAMLKDKIKEVFKRYK